MMLRIARTLLSAEIMGLMLVALALQILAYGIGSSLPNTDTTYFFTVCLIAAVIGLGLVKIKSKPIQASAWIVALGIAGIWFLGAHLAEPLRNLFQAFSPIFPKIIPALKTKTLNELDMTAVIAAWKVIADASAILNSRLLAWMIGVTQRSSVNDALIRDLVWLFMLWLVSAWIGWQTARRQAVTALIPAVLLLAFVLSYSEYKVETVWGLVVVMLLLMGVWNYKNHTHQWETHKIDYSDSIRYDNVQAVLLLALAVGVIAYITPSVTWKQIHDYFNKHNQTADSLGIQQQVGQFKSAPKPKPELPREHLLTGGVAQSQKIVMTIRTGELPPIPNPNLASIAPSYYWRSVVYDQYVGTGWVTSYAPAQKYPANTPLIPGVLSNYKALHLAIHMEEPDGKLVWSGTLFSSNVPLNVDWRLKPQENLFADQSVLLQADMFMATTQTSDFKVDSYVPNVSASALRAASDKYPQDILDRYLILPDLVPDRVRSLARQITRDYTTPYDKAKVIEYYLRKNYPYDLNVSAPPAGREVADYFLFDLKKGYCDYFATTMVVMARAAGLPARFVSGYSPGYYDAPNAQYVIRELNAHSWAEVYFTGIGWVEFEPTGSIPEINRTDTSGITLPQTKNDSAAWNLLNRFRFTKVAYVLVPVLIVLGLILLYFILLEEWWHVRKAPVVAIERIYNKFYRAGRPLAGEYTRAETSHEFAQKLNRTLDLLDHQTGYHKLFGSLKNNAAILTAIYDSVLFVDGQAQKQDTQHAWRTWTQLRWRLLIARLFLYRADENSETNRTWLEK